MMITTTTAVIAWIRARYGFELINSPLGTIQEYAHTITKRNLQQMNLCFTKPLDLKSNYITWFRAEQMMYE